MSVPRVLMARQLASAGCVRRCRRRTPQRHRHVDGPHPLDQRRHAVLVEHRLQLGDEVPTVLAGHDLELGIPAGVSQTDLHRELVELDLGQRVRSLEVEQVLRCHDHERPGHHVLAVRGDLAFFHHLEQGGLHLGERG